MTQRISMWMGYEPLIRSGAKRQTIRFRDPFTIGPAVIFFEPDDGRQITFPARVLEVRQVRRHDLTEQDALRDGFSSLDELQTALDTHYPGLADDVEIDVVTFEVTADS